MNFQNLELTEKSQKSSKKTASLKWHAFREKSQKIKKNKIFEIFWKISDFLMNFQNLELMKNTENQQAQKMENLHVFLRKLVHVFQGKKKDGFKKEMKLDL